ncbi:MAG: flagellar hook-length control protein FliK [Zoogloeaceae bacterium]|jgi:flagellar hook-length control protein FliK|nr:flagellar hook-length control protein FliK [Zoogloeaceae bacterium]
MSIQQVCASAVMGSSLVGAALEGDLAAGGFSGLLGLLLAGAGKDDAAAADLAALLAEKGGMNAPEGALQADLAQWLRQGQGRLTAEMAQAGKEALALIAPLDASAEQAALDAVMALPAPMPEALSPVLPEARESLAQGEEEANASLLGLGALSTPVEARQEAVLRLTPELRGQRAIAETAAETANGQSALALAGKDTEVLSRHPANLAAGAEDFAQAPRESLPYAQNRNPLAAGAFANPANAAANAGGMRQDALTTPLSSPAWAREFGEKIVWMARNDQHQARLSLYPAHLGPLSVTLNLEADKATAVFTAATQEARQAIEDALPRLREMFAAAGVSLGQTEVDAKERRADADAPHERHAALREFRRQHGKDATEDDDGTILATHLSAQTSGRPRHGAGMVDLFA